ncbi:MAG: fibronectin type III-like domain-contianing protein, partial [Candidatus Dormiibacterota bacterium]
VVSFPLVDRGFAYWDVGSNSWKVAPGCYDVMAGSSSRSLPLNGVISRGGASCGPGALTIEQATTNSQSGSLPATSAIPAGEEVDALVLIAAGLLVALLAGFLHRSSHR